MIRRFGRKAPRIHPSAFIHESAEIIGAARVGARASIWPGCVLRADVDRIEIGEASNIQDLSVIHCREGRPTVVGKGVTVGHRVVLHGCRVGDGCLIGMGAVVMEAEVGPRCLVGAGALVLAGMKIPPESLVIGSPAKVLRRLRPRELASLRASEKSYLLLAQRHRRSAFAV